MADFTASVTVAGDGTLAGLAMQQGSAALAGDATLAASGSVVVAFAAEGTLTGAQGPMSVSGGIAEPFSEGTLEAFAGPVVAGTSGTLNVTPPQTLLYMPANPGTFTIQFPAGTVEIVDSDGESQGSVTNGTLAVEWAMGEVMEIDFTGSAGTATWSYTERPVSALTLESDDVELEVTPAAIVVRLGNGEADDIITFDIVGGPAGIYSDDLDEYGMATFSVPIPPLAAGSYTLEATGSASGAATLGFTVLNNALDSTPDSAPDQAPVDPVVDPAQHWQFVDSADHSVTYTMPRNPRSWTNPERPNWFEHDATTAPDGQILTWQAADRAWTFEFSGYFDTKEEYDALLFWANLRRRFWLIDHRNRHRFVTFDQLDVRARVVPNKPWAHDYTVRVVAFPRPWAE